ncbi:type II toxin-antitoxin system VapC family toxin [Williamsia sp. CHRR-6]|uniref:type II toxin-antitoxin system VapC family toxin n=1 Tax=Williamsia sp. CHRR-6 TaxID=2835871 RepID=UPI001BDA563F|nr:type II toxin-antitoxin system VapC family toxin [Williamsia sp. CHRR-6]MBT0566065.1 type II toxin-antitoxin system VapC family toxin [Williamsia sp. CHRR-6]
MEQRRRVTAILLGTNALLWLATNPDRVAPEARAALSDRSNDLAVSAAPAWEIAVKSRLGRLDAEPLLAAWSETLAAMGVDDLAIDAADSVTACRLAWEHNDPFDRMVVAQALRRGLVIAASDQRMIAGALTPTIDTRSAR